MSLKTALSVGYMYMHVYVYMFLFIFKSLKNDNKPYKMQRPSKKKTFWVLITRFGCVGVSCVCVCVRMHSCRGERGS